MNRQSIFEIEGFEFQPQSELDEFELEPEHEAIGSGRCLPFIPVAVEMPGGGRIKNKTVPNRSDIVYVKGAFSKKVPLHRSAAAAHEALLCAARADGIREPLLRPTGSRSGFRDPEQQAAAWKRALVKYGSEENARKWVAKPGSSAHQSGRAIDFYLGGLNDSRNVTKLRQTPAYRWLAANAHRFGFYPYRAEPWHWEYNPSASRQPEIFAAMNEAFAYENESGEELEYETGRKCKKDWCSPDYIQWLQKSLNRLGQTGTKLREDGFHDERTLQAVKSFQKRHGLKPDGEVGPITEKTLVSQGASQPPRLKQLPCSPTNEKTLIAKLNKHRGNIPLHILLGWIEVESGRQIGSLTSLCERGYFQIYPGEAKSLGIKNHQLLSYDEDYSIQSGIKLINYFAARTDRLVKKYGLPSQGDVYWKVVKLHHWIPSGPEKILADMQALGVKPSSWAAIVSHALNPRNRSRLQQKIKRDPQQGINNADKMLSAANSWLGKLATNKSLARENEFFEEISFEQPNSASAPPLLKKDKAADGETLYVRIDLGLGKNLASTGIYVPNAFRPDSGIDVVLYLHGHKGAYPGNAVLINGYWDGARFPFFALREEVNASGQNVIFVAPSLGPFSQEGNLSRPGKFDAFMAQVLAGLNEHYLMPRYGRRVPNIKSIILAAHSGGGSPMLKITRMKDLNAAKIKECWCFDSMYGSVAPAWVSWAQSHPKQRLYVYYGPAKGQYNTKTGKKILLPRDNAEAIACASQAKGLTNVCVQPSRAKTIGKVHAHFWVPKVHLKERLLNSRCLAGDVCPRGRSQSRSKLEIPAMPGFAW